MADCRRCLRWQLGVAAVLLVWLHHAWPGNRASTGTGAPVAPSLLPEPLQSAAPSAALAAGRPAASLAPATPRQRATAAEPSVPAILLFAPHKTGSTFFTALMHDLSRLLDLCWYTDNAAFMYAPNDFSKCA